MVIADHPTLYDYHTIKAIRPATRMEELESIRAEDRDPDSGGLIIVDGQECFVWERGL